MNKNCIIFTIYDADSDKMMQISSPFTPISPRPPRTYHRGAVWATRIFFAGATRARRRLRGYYWLLAVGYWLRRALADEQQVATPREC